MKRIEGKKRKIEKEKYNLYLKFFCKYQCFNVITLLGKRF